MNYIGEFQKDSTILLELLTIDDKNRSIRIDFPATATIEHYERNGLQEVDNVKLETMVDNSKHTMSYRIPGHFPEGDYLITYKATANGKEYNTQEKFHLSRTVDLVQDGEIKTKSLVSGRAVVQDQASSVEEYIFPPEFAVSLARNPEVVNNKIIFTLGANMQYSQSYKVILTEGIRSVSGNTLSETKMIAFTSEYKPLFATPTEIQSALKGMFKYFTYHDIYVAIRDAGEKAMTLLGNVADANNSRYRDMRTTDTKLFPTQKYVLHEAARDLLTKLMIRILNGATDDTEEGLGASSKTGGSITLGDFSVSDSSSSSSTTGASTDEETQMVKLKAIIEANERDLKFWMDSMMGRNARGYASPVASSFRTAAGTPEGRDFS